MTEGRFIALAKPGTEEVMKHILLEDVTEQIRFESSRNDCLALVNGYINPQQMQMKRQLTSSSSHLFSAKWYSEPPRPAATTTQEDQS